MYQSAGKHQRKPHKRWEMCCEYTYRENFLKVKRLYSLGTRVYASGSENSWTGVEDGRGRRSHSIRLFVFPVYGAVSTPLLRQCACLWVHAFVYAIVCNCIPDTRRNYLVVFVKLFILVLQQVLHRLLRDEREKKRNEKYSSNSYRTDTHEITQG